MFVSPVDKVTMPVLYIGLGAAGVRCLELIQRRLSPDLTVGIRFLGIYMAGDSLSASHVDSELGDENLIAIEWNRDQATRVAESMTGYEWWTKNTSVDSSRLDARMAFHFMQYFEKKTRFNQYLRDVVQRLSVGEQNPLMLFVIVSLQEDESAFLADVMFEISRQIPNLSARIPCLLIELNGVGRSGGISPRACVALREAERLTKKGQFVCNVPTDWSAAYVSKDELFSRLLLLDNRSYLPALADQLAALAEKSAAISFNNDYGNSFSQPKASMMAVSRSFTFFIPTEEIRGICAIRLLKEEILDATYIIGGKINSYVMDFLQGDEYSPKEWKFFNALFSALDRNKKIEEFNWADIVYGSLFRNSFYLELCRFFNSKFQGALKDFSGFLFALHENVSKAIDECDRRGGWLDGIFRQKPLIQGMIKDFNEEVLRWSRELADTRSFLDNRQDQIGREARGAFKETLYQRALFDNFARGMEDLDFGNAYYARLKEAAHVWRELTNATRQSLTWEWAADNDQKPFLKCGVDNHAYSKAQDISDPLWLKTRRLIKRFSDAGAVFEFLARQSSQSIKATLDNAPPSAQYDPHPMSSRYEYLICADNPAIHDWSLPSEVQFCRTDNKERLTYLRLDYNLPMSGFPFYKEYEAFLETTGESEPPFVFPHEQNAWRIEQKMRAKGVSGRLPADFVRLMHNADDFDLVMLCIFWGWLDFNKEHKRWQLDTGAEVDTSVNLDATSIEKAVFNLLIHFPFEDVSGIHPLSKNHYGDTLASVRKKIKEYQNCPPEQRQANSRRLMEKIETWQTSKSHFEQGLALYQKYLLAGADVSSL